MKTNLSAIAYALSVDGHLPVLKRTHAAELTVASMGYKSLAAFQSAIFAGKEAEHFHATKHLIFDEESVFNRAKQLGLDAVHVSQVSDRLDRAFKKSLPGISIDPTFDSFEDRLRDFLAEAMVENVRVQSEFEESNADSYADVDLEYKFEIDHAGGQEVLEILVSGHVTLNLSPVRPYWGHRIKVDALLTLPRLGRRLFGELNVEVNHAELDLSYLDDDGPPATLTLGQALAEELKLDIKDTSPLDDLDAVPNESEDGLLYGYDFRFDDVPNELKQLIAERHPGLRIRVGPNFFDRIRRDL